MTAISVRLLSSVAVVGRENEPIYLCGGLCDAATSLVLEKLPNGEFHVDETDADTISVQDGDGPKTDKVASEKDEDPFGFFTDQPHAMSLTNQLVLHASLDRFEEMSRSNSGMVRWRMPGNNGANAMWIGLLCEVEERWNVYGYLTNTGIKFMLIVENVQISEDGVRFDATPSFVNQSLHREADLKHMFSRLHELYVRYTLNPFSKLRSPIQSRVFDEGIFEMAREFNACAVKMANTNKIDNEMSWT